jgi:hypothetical protein
MTKVTRVADVLTELRPLLERARKRLSTKLIGANSTSRNVFLVVHPFDHLALELKHGIIGPLLPPLSDIGELNTVWVLWVPDHLAVWSHECQTWISVMVSLDDVSADRLSPLQVAEARFLDSRGDKGSSPYLFTLSKEPE